MLSVFAGKRAYAHVRKNGLQPSDVNRVMGASGAAKWLAIAGLDKAIFGRWFSESNHEVTLFGTSVGAFKLAAAAHLDPSAALDRLATAYIEQRYGDKLDADSIAVQMLPVLDAVAGMGAAGQVLSNPCLRLQFGAVRCLDKQLASGSGRSQQLGLARAFAANLRGRSRLARYVQRTVFIDPRSTSPLVGDDSSTTQVVQLSMDNYRPALLASGSLPVYMQAVSPIHGAAAGVYRDGGLLDYHPLPVVQSREVQSAPNLVLYPHFYSTLTEGWFDKFLNWRAVDPKRLDEVILLAPSAAHVSSLQGRAIPDRRDFNTFQGQDEQRIQRWRSAVASSDVLGELFLEWVKSGEIAARIQPI